MNTHQSNGEQLLSINGDELCFETFGDRTSPAITLVALTFVSTSNGADDLPPPSSDLAEPDSSDAAAVVEYVVAGAEPLVLEGAGHDLPEPVWEEFVTALARHTEGGRS